MSARPSRPSGVPARREPSYMPHSPNVLRLGSRGSLLQEASHSISVLPLRGNVDTRLRKLREGEYDVIVLAMAGLRRTNLYDPSVMRPVDLLPAPGQGALALQCRLADTGTSVLLAP